MKDSQRKAMFARMSGLKRLGFSDVSARFYAQKGVNPGDIKQKNFRQLQKQGIYLKYAEDNDHDGVKNVNDCQPLNHNKQGIIHDIKMGVLKKREEAAERKREAAQQNISDLKDELELRRSASNKELGVKQSEVAAKQRLAEQIRKEELTKNKLAKEESAVKKELKSYTWQGKAETEIKRRWNTPQSKKNRAKAVKIAKTGFKKLWRQIK